MKFLLAMLGAAVFLLSDTGLAGVLLAGSLGSGSFSFRPQGQELTPNYLGFTPGLALGFSYKQHLDTGLFGEYTFAGFERFARPTQASLIFAGAQVAARFKGVTMGLRGGWAQYHLLRVNDVLEEIPGEWRGTGGGFFMGSLLQLAKKHYLQIAFEYNQLAVKPLVNKAVLGPSGRTIDQVMITVTYTFNEFINYLIGNTLFESIIKDI